MRSFQTALAALMCLSAEQAGAGKPEDLDAPGRVWHPPSTPDTGPKRDGRDQERLEAAEAKRARRRARRLRLREQNDG